MAQNVIEGLEKMDVDTPLVSVKKAGQKLEHAARVASEDSLVSIDNFSLDTSMFNYTTQ